MSFLRKYIVRNSWRDFVHHELRSPSFWLKFAITFSITYAVGHFPPVHGVSRLIWDGFQAARTPPAHSLADRIEIVFVSKNDYQEYFNGRSPQ